VATLGASTPTNIQIDAERWVLLLIALTLAGRVLLAVTLGLGIDESYTVATSRTFVLSTYDHPPMAWWLAGATRRLFGSEAALAVRVPFILLFALTTWLMFALTRILFGSRAGLFAALTLNLAPVLAWTTGTFVLPDGPLLAALLAGAYCVARVLFVPGSPAALWWLGAGACGGLACLSKLHGGFLFAGTALFLLTTPSKRRWMLTPWPYLGTAVACLLFLPVIVWNVQHDWVSFAFQSRRAHVVNFEILAPLNVLAGHAVFILPWLWVPLVVSLVRALICGPQDERGWLVTCLAIGPIVVFTLVAVSGNTVLYHWAAPGYLFAFALLGRDLAGMSMARARGVWIWLMSTAASLTVLLAAVLALAKLPWPPMPFAAGHSLTYPLIETLPWGELKIELAQRGLLTQSNHFVAATRWHEAGRIDIALEGQLPVRCLCNDARGYGFIHRNAEHAGADALIVGRNLSKNKIETALAACFREIHQLSPVSLHQGGAPLVELQLFLGRHFTPSDNGPACDRDGSIDASRRR